MRLEANQPCSVKARTLLHFTLHQLAPGSLARVLPQQLVRQKPSRVVEQPAEITQPLLPHTPGVTVTATTGVLQLDWVSGGSVQQHHLPEPQRAQQEVYDQQGVCTVCGGRVE